MLGHLRDRICLLIVKLAHRRTQRIHIAVGSSIKVGLYQRVDLRVCILLQVIGLLLGLFLGLFLILRCHHLVCIFLCIFFLLFTGTLYQNDNYQYKQNP